MGADFPGARKGEWSLIVEYIKEFGIIMLVRNGVGRILRKLHIKQDYLNIYDNWKHKYVKKWLYERYHSVIITSPDKKTAGTIERNHLYVWTFWWQGEQEAPDIVRCCINSMKKNTRNKVVVLSKDNLNEYCDLPEYILKKVESGKIGLAHFSDIVRFYLLNCYGGIWMDSTCFLAKDFPEEYFTHSFYTYKNFFDSTLHWKWTSFFMICEKGNIIAKNMVAFFAQYWEEHECAITYLLLDCWLEVLYENVRLIKEEIDSIPEKYITMKIGAILNGVYCAEEWKNAVIEGECLTKLTYKQHLYETTAGGEKTFYGYVKELYFT